MSSSRLAAVLIAGALLAVGPGAAEPQDEPEGASGTTQVVAERPSVDTARTGAPRSEAARTPAGSLLAQCLAGDLSDGELAERVARKLEIETFPSASAEQDPVSGWDVVGPDHAWEFHVEVDRGVVTLAGEVPRATIIRHAIAAAREVPCVGVVRSEMVVRRDPY